MKQVKFSELVPCRTAFVDTHNPGAEGKENFTIIGGGVSENPEQYVHIEETPGFNIGGARQPAGCTNSLHSHRTAEVFIIHTGSWRMFWGLEGDDGEVVLNPGDLISLPTHMFRGFENVTPVSATNETGSGFIFSVLGGDDSGGGVLWAPEVLQEARNHGLTLLESGQLVNTREGEEIPAGIPPMTSPSEAELSFYSRNTITDASKVVVTRPGVWAYRETELIGRSPNAAIGERPGFEIRRVQWGNGEEIPWRVSNLDTVLISNTGSVVLSGGETLGPGDVTLIQAGEEEIDVKPLPGGASELFIVIATNDPAGETRLLDGGAG
ncbi:MAG TPA: cupin [Alphaproteobacteria bacterium]|nr:cupin [Alphaproteobacteria bacterium]